jgi:hypothetical protein
MMGFPWGVVGMVVVAFAAGWFAGYKFEAERFADYRAKVMAEVRSAAAKQEEMVKRHEQTKQYIEQDYESRLADIESYYRELLDDSASGDGVSPVPAAPSGAHGTATCKPVPVVTKECAQTALKLKELQDWIRGVSR